MRLLPLLLFWCLNFSIYAQIDFVVPERPQILTSSAVEDVLDSRPALALLGSLFGRLEAIRDCPSGQVYTYQGENISSFLKYFTSASVRGAQVLEQEWRQGQFKLKSTYARLFSDKPKTPQYALNRIQQLAEGLPSKLEDLHQRLGQWQTRGLWTERILNPQNLKLLAQEFYLANQGSPTFLQENSFTSVSRLYQVIQKASGEIPGSRGIPSGFQEVGAASLSLDWTLDFHNENSFLLDRFDGEGNPNYSAMATEIERVLKGRSFAEGPLDKLDPKGVASEIERIKNMQIKYQAEVEELVKAVQDLRAIPPSATAAALAKQQTFLKILQKYGLIVMFGSAIWSYIHRDWTLDQIAQGDQLLASVPLDSQTPKETIRDILIYILAGNRSIDDVVPHLAAIARGVEIVALQCAPETSSEDCEEEK